MYKCSLTKCALKSSLITIIIGAKEIGGGGDGGEGV